MVNAEITTVKVAIVEAHSLMRRSLASWIDGLNHRFKVTQECVNGSDLVSNLRSCPEASRPDIVITAYQMPGMDGYEVTTWLKKRFPNIKVLIFSIQSDDVVIIRLIKAGISGYLAKSVDGDEILAALETVIEGGTYFKKLDRTTITNLPDIEPAVKAWYSLTEMEREFVRLCTMDLSGLEIKRKLGGYQFLHDQAIVKIYEKFGVKSRIALVLLVAKYRLFELNLI